MGRYEDLVDEAQQHMEAARAIKHDPDSLSNPRAWAEMQYHAQMATACLLMSEAV
jgi:hypothetical protein